MDKCSDVMTKGPACCLPTDPCQKVAKLMASKDVGPVPVIDNEQNRKLLGIVTDRDLALKIVAEAKDPKTTKAQDVMTKKVRTVHPNDDVQRALDIMTEQRLRRICVVDDNEKLVGIVAQADIATRYNQPQKVADVVKAISQAHGSARGGAV